MTSRARVPRARIIINVGDRFGRLVVESREPKRRGDAYWLCRCDCGGTNVVRQSYLNNGNVKSCGCLKRETMARNSTPTKHGMARTPEFFAWRGMRARCGNPNSPNYALYGGRGISVCERWCASFEAFFADVGPRPSAGHSVDRIDVNGNYEPGNVRWATNVEQSRNTRNTIYLTHNGVTMPLADWADRLGLAPGTVRKRIRDGWDHARALTPSRGWTATRPAP